MSEKFESSIERLNTRVTFEIGRKSVLFDMLNSQLYEHAEQYKEFDHVFRKNDDKLGGTYYFRSDFGDLYSTLDEYNFPKSRVPYPTEKDEEVWTNMQLRYIERDLQEFEGSDE